MLTVNASPTNPPCACGTPLSTPARPVRDKTHRGWKAPQPRAKRFRPALKRTQDAREPNQWWCLEPESNRYACLKAADFKSAVSTNFTIEALARLSLNFNGDLIAHEAPVVLNACQCGRCRISLWHVRAETASKASLPRLDHPVALRPPKATAD